MFGLFKKEKNYEELITEFINHLFIGYGIDDPKNKDVLNASLGIAIAMTAILNDIGKGTANSIIDEISNAAQRKCNNLTFRISEVGADSVEIEKIIAEFPSFANASPDMRTNGNALFPILFNLRGPQLVNDILEHNSGPLGTPGYAMIVIGDMIVGKEKSKESFMQHSMLLLDFIQKVVK